METTNTKTQINRIEFFIEKTSFFSTGKENIIDEIYTLSTNSRDWMNFTKQDLINLRDLLIRLFPGD